MLIFLLTLLHFAVDGICGAALATYETAASDFSAVLYFFGLYNLIAFGGQWLAGWITDRYTFLSPHTFPSALLLLGGGSIAALGMPVQAVLLGLGNCLFHAAAGGMVLRYYVTYKEPGIFVSGGAVGLALGLNGLCGEIFFLLVAASAILLLPGFLKHACRTHMCEPLISVQSKPPSVSVLSALIGCVVLLLGCVVLRGFAGSGHAANQVLLFPCIFALGKILGGLCCDRFGYNATVLLIFILGFIGLQWTGLLPTLLTILAFNMTMPLTLRLLHRCNPSRPGLMFGLAAGCLLPGAFFHSLFTPAPQVMLVVQFLSLFAAGVLISCCGNTCRDNRIT